MATITINGFIHASHDAHRGTTFHFFATDMTSYGHVLIAPHTITVEVPDDFDPNAAIRSELERKRAAALDAAAQAERELERLTQVAGKAE